MQVLSTVLLVLVGVVNLLPLVGVLSTERLRGLYGIVVDEPNLVILMRHRAVLFGILGALMIASAFDPSLQPVGIAVGLASMLSYVALAYVVGGYNAELRRIIVIDVAASALLVAAAAMRHFS
jgi:hypothetical protein